MKNSLVDIVIVNWNAGSYLHDCIKSIVDNKNDYGFQNYSGLINKVGNYKFSKFDDINQLNFKPIFLKKFSNGKNSPKGTSLFFLYFAINSASFLISISISLIPKAVNFCNLSSKIARTCVSDNE